MTFNEYLFLHRPSKTLIITDAALHFGAESHGSTIQTGCKAQWQNSCAWYLQTSFT